MPGEPTTARGRMEALWNAGHYDKALAMAAKWHDLGTAKDIIVRGHEARVYPNFYRGMDKAPEMLYRAGLLALAARYTLTPPPRST